MTYNPHKHVPDRIDKITADGLVKLHEALNERNAERLRSVPPEEQKRLLWRLVRKNTISVEIGEGWRTEQSNSN